MANWYVRSGATGTATGADWTNAKTTLAAAATAAAAGDDIWVSSDHAESTAATTTVTFPGTATSPNRCISVNRAGSVPPVAADITAGATVTVTGNSQIIFNGSVYGYGFTFNVGTLANSVNLAFGNAASSLQKWENCTGNVVATATGAGVFIGNGATCSIELINSTLQFANASQGIAANCNFTWRNKPGSTAITGATLPTTLIKTSANRSQIVLDGLDLSALGSGATIHAATVSGVDIKNCKLGSSVTVAATPTTALALGTRVLGSGTSTLVERNEFYQYQGTLTTETTIIRTAGASDGTTAYSWKIVSTANAKRTFPFETFEGAVWNSATGSSKTLTFHCVTDNVTLQDADIWVEVEYLGDSTTPVATLVSSAPATQLTAGANLTSDSGEAWTTTGLTTPVKQKFSVTFTPQMIGAIRWKVKVAKASTTVYVDPNPDLA